MRKRLKQCIAVILSVAIIVTAIPIAVTAQDVQPVNDLTEAVTSDSTTSPNSQAKILSEIVERREEDTKHFYMSDGTILAAKYNQPIHYLENGEWQDIDNSFSDAIDSENENVFENKKNKFKVKFAKKAKKNKLVTIKDEDLKIRWSVEGSEKVNAEIIEENSTENSDITALKNINKTVVYKDILQNTDIFYTVTSNSVKENIVLKNSNSPESFVFNYDLYGLSYRVTEDNKIEIFDASNPEEVLYVIEKAFMFDDNGEYCENITLTVVETSKGIKVTITPDKEWINAESRAWPVTIDPTITAHPNTLNVEDTYIVDSHPNSTYDTSFNLLVGTENGSIYRSMIKFNNLPELKPFDSIVSAVLHLNIISGPYYDTAIEIYTIGTPWFASLATWQDNSELYMSDIENIIKYDVSSGSIYAPYITSTVAEWYNSPTANYGLMIKASDETESNNLIYFYSSDFMGNDPLKPTLSINYRSGIGLENYWSYTVQDSGKNGVGYVNNYNGNLIYVHNDVSNNLEMNPFVVSHIYNTEYVNDNNRFGNSWRLSIMQYLDPVNIANSNAKYVYTDGDGTKHYFIEVDGILKDEDGLGFTLTLINETVDEGNTPLKYQIKTTSGEVYKFDNWNCLRRIYDTNGNCININYSPGTVCSRNNNYPTSITTSTSESISFNYNLDNRLSLITDKAGRAICFSYGDNGNLISIERPDMEITTFTYDDYGKITKVNCHDNTSYNYTYYDDEIKTVTFKSSDGFNGNSLTFNYKHNQTVITDSQNRKCTYQFDTFGRPVCVYDDQENIFSQNYNPTSHNSSEIFKNNKLATASNTLVYNNNFIDNGSFEEGLKYWSGGTVIPQASLTENGGYASTRGVKISSTQVGNYYITSNYTNFTYNDVYTLSARIKTENVVSQNGGAYISALIGAEGNQYSEMITGTTDVEIEDGYKLITFDLDLTQGRTLMSVSIGLYNASGTVWVDCVQLEQGDSANQVNLINNSSFEYNDGETPYFFTLSPGTTIIKNSTYHKHGGKSYGFNGVYDEEKYLKQELDISGNAGDVYSFGAWGKAHSVQSIDNSSTFKVVCEFSNTDNTVQRVDATFNPSVNEWQFTSQNAIAQKAYNKITLYLRYDYNCNTVLFDNVFLYRDTANCFRYDDNGNVVSSIDYAEQKSSFDYKNENLQKMVTPSGTDYEYAYGYSGRNNLVFAKSADGVGYQFGYNIYNGSYSPVVSQITANYYSSSVQNGHIYYIRNRLTGKNMQPYNKQSVYGTNIVQYSPEDDTHQRWYIVDAGEGYVYIQVADFSGYRLSVKNATATTNQPLELTYNTGDETKFKIVFNSDGAFYSLRSKLDENMAVCSNLGSLENNNQILLYPYDQAGHDRGWIFTEPKKSDYTEVEVGKHCYISDMYASRYFDIPGFNSTYGTPLTQYSYLGGKNQRFNIINIGEYYMILPLFANELALSVADDGETISIQEKDNLDTKQYFSITPTADGGYRITPYHHTTKAVSLPNGTVTPSGAIKALEYTGKLWQHWRFEEVKTLDAPEDAESYYIYFCHNYQYFDIPDMRTGEDAILTQHPFNSGLNQQFKLIATSDGYFKLQAMHTNMVKYITMVPNASATDGSGTLCLKDEQNSVYQEFKFVSAPYNFYRMVCRASGSDAFAVEAPNCTNTFSAPLVYSAVSGSGSSWQWVKLEKVGTVMRSTATYSENGSYMTSSTDSRGNTTTYNYIPEIERMLSTTDAKGNTTNYAYSTSTDQLLIASKGNSTVGYDYDNYNRLSTITSPSETEYSFEYDTFGRSTGTKIGERYLSNIYYKNNYSSLVSSIAYGNWNEIYYNYDNLDRLTEVRFNSDLALKYHYNKTSQLTRLEDRFSGINTVFNYDIIGRLLGITNSAGNGLYYKYDSLNRIYESKLKLNGIGLKTGFVYGNSANTAQKPNLIYGVTLNGSEKLNYRYDNFNRLSTRILNTTTPFVTKYGYLEGASSNETTTLVKTVKNGNTVLEYTYDQIGNITSIKKNGAVIESYEYDSLNQLTRVTNSSGVYVYTYDNGGNILSVTKNGEVIKTYEYIKEGEIQYGNPDWKDILAKFNGNTIRFDNVGNAYEYQGLLFEWQNGRQLHSITEFVNNTTIYYGYDGEGNRISKTVGGVTTDFYWLNGILQGQKTGDEHIVFLYDENGTAYGMLVKNGATENYYYYVFNLQGDVIGILDSDGNEVVQYTYDVWGDLLSITGTLADTIGQKNPIRYRGYYYDNETGYYYLQSRYYDPEVGRFINADNVIAGVNGEILGYNLFAYCQNNPVNMQDETGSWPKWVKKAWNKVKSFVTNTFGVGIVQTQKYKAIEVNSIIYGSEEGGSTTKVIKGDISKPVSLYIENASEWWKFNEYKVGVQINTKDGGFSYSANIFEASVTVADKNSSFEMIAGLNKIGYTNKTGVDFKNRTADLYYHEYIRTIPTAAAVVTTGAVCYYGGEVAATAFISLLFGGSSYAY